ncbi:hypothetical protein NSTC745_06461 [Nostoc sp. DSM 114161]
MPGNGKRTKNKMGMVLAILIFYCKIIIETWDRTRFSPISTTKNIDLLVLLFGE